MFSFLAAAITSLAVAFEFLSDQFGLSGLTARTFWFFAAEAFLVAGLLKWALSAFGVVPVKRRAYWIAISVLVLAVLLTVNRIGNPPRALPHLQAQIDSVVFSDAAQEPAAGLLVVPAVTIGNAGESSIAEHFDLALHLPDGRVVHGEPRAIPERFAIPFPDGSALVVYGEDSLDRLRTRPIPRDGVTLGRLAYLFPSLTRAEAAGGGVFCQLTMRDAWGRVSATPMTPAGVGAGVGSAGDVPSHPGLRSAVTLPDTATPAASAPARR